MRLRPRITACLSLVRYLLLIFIRQLVSSSCGFAFSSFSRTFSLPHDRGGANVLPIGFVVAKPTSAFTLAAQAELLVLCLRKGPHWHYRP